MVAPLFNGKNKPEKKMDRSESDAKVSGPIGSNTKYNNK